MTTNTKTQDPKIPFARLSRAARERAYAALRAKVGPSYRISLPELEQAHKEMR